MSSEAQRTLVKSPPELWAELSDPAALARHLGELGEIRVTRTAPEELVEWEAEAVSGTVRIEPSGWGTKVTLTVTRKVPEPQPEAVAEADSDCMVETEPPGETEPEAQGKPEAQSEPELPAGFFARLRIRLRRRREPDPETPLEPEPASAPELTSAPEPAPVEETPDLAVELARVEEVLVEQDAALLTRVLDRLGAAHHRPFSRA